VVVLKSTNAQLKGNLIGVAANGTSPLVPTPVDQSYSAVVIDGSTSAHVGGTGPGEANTIAFRGTGVVISALNGTSLGNQVRGNSIHSNIAQGIDTRNGGNGEPAPPVISSATQTGATGTSTGCAPCAIDLYSDNADEGRIFEGTTQTDLAGNWTFVGDLAGPNVTATRTDDGGNTSEFSAPFELPQPTPTPTLEPTPTPTPTVTPTSTATPTATPTPTPTPTPSGSPGPLTQGDVDCNGEVSSVDALKELRHVAQLSVSQNEPCPDIGEDVASVWGDVDCNGEVTSVDALKVLRHVADLSVSQTEPCPDIGETAGQG
jgi:hypothetical protein